MISLIPDLQDRHSRDHNHDLNKVLTLFLNLLGKLLKDIISLTTHRDTLADLTSTIFAGALLFVLGGHTADLTLNVGRNVGRGRGGGAPSEGEGPGRGESWLVTVSKVLTIVGTLCYYLGNNLPGVLQRSEAAKVECGPECVRRGVAVAKFFLFLSLTTFIFVPSLFRKINSLFNTQYHKLSVAREENRPVQMQWFLVHLTALVLQFDVVYTGIWSYAVGDRETCNIDDVVASVCGLIVGWFTWSFYAFSYSCYLRQVSSTLLGVAASRRLPTRYCLLNVSFNVTAILFLATFFPTYMLVDNELPLGCACDTYNHTLVIVSEAGRGAHSGCEGVLVARLVLSLYQVTLLCTLAVLTTVKFSLKKTKDM